MVAFWLLKRSVWVTTVCLGVLVTWSVAQQNMESLVCPEINAENFEFWNYYEILGLEEPGGSKSVGAKQRSRRAFDKKDIVKAYRKQAQIYHPDKLKSKKDGKNMTAEESTARFARIAEAYEALADASKKEEYDEFLRICEKKKKSSSGSATKSSFSTFFEDLSFDTMKVFGDFFFGSDGDDMWLEPEGTANERRGYSSSGSRKRSGRRRAPDNIYESQERLVDPYTGREWIRVLKREEYVQKSSTMIYYRIVAQDFVEKMDRRSGRLFLQPVSEQYVIEDGYHDGPFADTFYGQSNDRSSLEAGEALRRGDILTSPNKRYYAGLSDQCELMIMSDYSHIGKRDDAVWWTSDTYVPGGQCFLALDPSDPSRLIVALGSLSRFHQILWVSDGSYRPEPGSSFFVRLDNDGSLAVYESERRSISDMPWNRYPVVRNLSDFLSNIPPHLKPPRAWTRLGHTFAQSLLGWDYSAENFVVVRSCVFSTSPFGCNRLARRTVQLVRDSLYFGRYVAAILERRLDWILSVYEDEEDILDVAFRILEESTDFVSNAFKMLSREATFFAKRIFDY